MSQKAAVSTCGKKLEAILALVLKKILLAYHVQSAFSSNLEPMLPKYQSFQENGDKSYVFCKVVVFVVEVDFVQVKNEWLQSRCNTITQKLIFDTSLGGQFIVTPQSSFCNQSRNALKHFFVA